MIPIIRRIRRPLLPSEEPVTAQPLPLSPSPPSAPFPRNDGHPISKKRSDSDQFRSDSLSSKVLLTAEDQPSTVNPQPPNAWSLQPNEPADAYHLFASWLQLPAPRTFRKTATALGCSIHRLRQLSSRYDWKARARAFDNHRANAASKALDRLLEDEVNDFQERARRFRLQEWLLHEEMLESAFAVSRELRRHPGRASMTELTRLFDLISKLGRRASGMPLDSDAKPNIIRPRNYEAEAALEKIYGSDPDTEPPTA